MMIVSKGVASKLDKLYSMEQYAVWHVQDLLDDEGIVIYGKVKIRRKLWQDRTCKKTRRDKTRQKRTTRGEDTTIIPP